MPSVIAYGCDDAATQFHPLQIDIREPGEGDIYFDVAYAGICHSDIHSARSEWGPVSYPLVPGHEFVGTVAKVGPGVTKFELRPETWTLLMVAVMRLPVGSDPGILPGSGP